MWFNRHDDWRVEQLEVALREHRKDYWKLVEEVRELKERLELPIPAFTCCTRTVPLEKAVQAILSHLNIELVRVPAAEESVRVRQK